jgi:hypothetical protein
LFDYLAVNPDRLANPEDCLFSGSVDSQAQRFHRIVTKLKIKHKDTIKRVYNFELDDIGVHSWRKGAHTKLNTGSTAGPSAAAACIRGGHSMGGNRDVYIAQSQASDNFCGRVLAGLPEHDPRFAVAYPDFIGIDAERSLADGGVSGDEVAAVQARVNDNVELVLYSIFGEERIQNFQSFVPLLRVGLASHLMHRKYYEEHLPDNAILKTTPLFTNPLVLEIKKFVHIAMPWEDKYKYFQPATGLPPHIIISAYMRGMHEDILAIPAKIEEMLQQRQMAGPLSLAQIAERIENGPKMKAMQEDLAFLKNHLLNGGTGIHVAAGTSVGTRIRPTTRHNMRLFKEYHHNGNYRRVPSTWKFPALPLQNMYVYWHCGDEEGGIPPMKYLECSDIDFIKRGKKALSEIKSVMQFIDKQAISAGVAPKDLMTQIEANSCYHHAEAGIKQLIPSHTPQGRTRDFRKLKVAYVVKFVRHHS